MREIIARIQNMGRDQKLIKTKEDIDILGKKIASMHDGWYYKSQKIYQKEEREVKISNFILGTVTSSVCLILIWAMLVMFYNEDIEINYDIVVWASLFVGVFWMGIKYLMIIDPSVDYIKFREAGEYNTILLKLYDNDGYRNIDDDDVDKIQNLLEAGS